MEGCTAKRFNDFLGFAFETKQKDSTESGETQILKIP